METIDFVSKSDSDAKGTKPLILHVDDDEAFLELFAVTFEEDMKIISVNSPDTVLQHLEKGNYEAVISDYDMPEMDGLELLKLIKDRFPSLPVIFCTGQGNEDIAREAFVHGASDYFTKDLFGFAHRERFANSVQNAIRIKKIEEEKKLNQQALRESQERFRLAFMTTPDPVCITRLKDGLCLDINRGFTEVLGYTREEINGRSIKDINVWHNPSERDKIISILKKEGQVKNKEVKVRKKDGTVIEMLFSAGILFLNGQPHMLSIVRDITQWKKAEKARMISERQYRLLFESMMEAFALHQIITDEQGKPIDYIFIEINPAFEEMTGLKKESLINRRVTEVLPGIEKDPFDWIGVYGKVALTGEPIRFEQYSPPLDRWYDVSAYSPKEGFFAVIFSNITERKKSRERIEHLNRVLKAIRNVNQLIVQEKDPQQLIDKATQMLTETGGYGHSWIVLIDEEMKFLASSHSGFEQFQELCRAIKGGRPSECIKRILDSKEIIFCRKDLDPGCPMYGVNPDNITLIHRLEYEGRIYGAMSISMPTNLYKDEEEQSLFLEVVGDIAYALHNIEMEKLRLMMEEELRREKEIKDRLMETSPMGIVQIDADGRIVYANPWMEKTLKVERDKIINRTYNAPQWKNTDLRGNPIADEELPVSIVLRTGKSVLDVRHFTTPLQGKPILLSVNASPLFERDGKMSGVVVVAQDITHWIEHEEAILKEKERFRNYLDLVGVIVVALNEKGEVTLINKKGCEILGCPEEEILGKNWFLNYLPEKMRETVYGVFLQLIAGTGQMMEYFENPLINRRGEERLISWHNVVIRDKEGNIREILSAGEDITEQRRIDEDLRREKEVKDRIMETSPVGISVVDMEGNIIYANPWMEKTLGVTKSEIIKRTYNDPRWKITDFDGNPLPDENLPFSLVMKTQKPVSDVRHAIENPQGERILLTINASPLFDRDGKISGVVGVVQNITSQIQTEQALRRSYRAMEVLAESNRKILHIRDERELVEEICRSIVEKGGYRFAWMGFKDEVSKEIVPFSYYGFEDGYLDGIKVSYDDSIPEGGGPCGTAIRTGKPSVCNSTSFNGAFAPWREKALQRGYMSLISLPVTVNNDTIGALCIYSADPHAFDEDEVNLLTTLVGDLSFALSALRIKKEQEFLRQELIESQSKYKDLIENLSEGVWVIDAEGKTTLVNPCMAEMLGYTQEEMTGRHLLDFMDDRARKICEENLERRRQGITETYTFEFLKKDGTTVYTRLQTSPLYNDQGEYIGAIAGIIDITLQREAERELKKSQSKALKLEQIINNSNTVVCLWKNEQGWPVEYISQNIQNWGYNAEDFYSGKLLFADIIHPEDLSRVLKEVEYNTSQKTPHYTQEYRIINNQGEILHIEDHTWLRLNEKGEITHYQGILTDITIRKEMEQALVLEKEKAQKYLDMAGVMIVILDQEGRISLINKKGAEILGYTEEELIGKEWFENFVPQEFRKIPKEMFFSVINRNEKYVKGVIPPVRENFVLNRDGKLRLIRWFHNLVTDREGKVIAVMSSGEDITEENRMKEMLQNKNKELVDFTYRVSHGLKSPLSIIRGYLYAIQSDPAVFDKYYPRIMARSDEMSKFIDNLLNLSRVGKVMGKKKEIEIEYLISRIFNNLKIQDVKAELNLASTLPVIIGDPEGIEQVFSNLIQNSVQYRDPEKERVSITVESVREEGKPVIIYKDNGMGVEEQYLDKIFTPGFTVDKEKGTGFGLAIVRAVVEAHGGNITVRSEGLKKGLEFTITGLDVGGLKSEVRGGKEGVWRSEVGNRKSEVEVGKVRD